jgi:cytidyltransferase-like protein
MKVVLVTGGFDPLHSGHISYFEEAKKLGDKLVVGLNSDEWLTRKKGLPFMPLKERKTIIQNLKMVDEVITWDDSDNTACGAIFKLKLRKSGNQIIFCNGGDRTEKNIPEMEVYKDNGEISFVFGVGGTDKKNSSSWILEEYKYPKTKRNWGWYRVLDNQPGYKVKELVIDPKSSLSMQRHFKRAEHWYVLKGECIVVTDGPAGIQEVILPATNTGYQIGKEIWHKGINEKDVPCHILEVQYGDECVEADIERKEFTR